MACWLRTRHLPACGGCEDDDVILALPDTRQTLPHDCGRAVLRCAWDYLGVKKRPVPMTPLDGTSPDTLEAILRESGVRVLSGEMTVADLKEQTARGRPVLTVITDPELGGHWVCVAGVHRGRVRYQCPVKGPQAVPVVEFEGWWTDITRRAVRYDSWGLACFL